MLFLVLKRALGLKTSYVHAFGKLLVFVHQKYHTLENNVDWTKIYPSKHVQLSLISVVYLLYLIIIGTFLCACLCVNIWRIIALLLAFYETKGILVILTM